MRQNRQREMEFGFGARKKNKAVARITSIISGHRHMSHHLHHDTRRDADIALRVSHQSHQSFGSHRHMSIVSSSSPMTRVAMSACRHHARKNCSTGWAGLGWAGVRELTRPSRVRPLGTLFWAVEPISNVCDWFKQRLLHIPSRNRFGTVPACRSTGDEPCTFLTNQPFLNDGLQRFDSSCSVFSLEMSGASSRSNSSHIHMLVVGERMAGWFLWRTVRQASREDRREKHRERHRDVLMHRHRQGEKPRRYELEKEIIPARGCGRAHSH